MIFLARSWYFILFQNLAKGKTKLKRPYLFRFYFILLGSVSYILQLSFKFLKKSLFKACVRYFYQIFIFSPNDSPSKTMKNAFYFIKKALFSLEIIKFFYFCPSLSFLALSHCFRGWSKINLRVYDAISCLNKNLIQHFVCYLEKEKRYNTESLSIDGVSKKEHFYGKIMLKTCSKS